jgi:hypothetical protein
MRQISVPVPELNVNLSKTYLVAGHDNISIMYNVCRSTKGFEWPEQCI